MKLDVRWELPQWLLIAGMFLSTAIIWPSTPDRVPTHWNAAGEVDGYGGRFMGLLLLPLVTLGLYLLLYFIPRIDPKRASYASFAGAYGAIRIATIALMAVIHALVLLWIKGIKINATVVVLGGVGVLFIVIGLAMGNIQPNWFAGIRTPWTLSSKRSWEKTHRLGRWVFTGMGLAMIGAGFLAPALMLPVILIVSLGGSGVLVAYSYVQWRNDPNRRDGG